MIYVDAPFLFLLFPHLNQKTFHFFTLDHRGIFPLLRQLQHDVRDLDILLRLVLGGDLEDDVLLVGGDGLLADGLDESGHPIRYLLALCRSIVSRFRCTYFMGRRSLFFDAG